MCRIEELCEEINMLENEVQCAEEVYDSALAELDSAENELLELLELEKLELSRTE